MKRSALTLNLVAIVVMAGIFATAASASTIWNCSCQFTIPGENPNHWTKIYDDCPNATSANNCSAKRICAFKKNGTMQVVRVPCTLAVTCPP